ncbi:hypothetical protein RO575_02670 [Methylomonas sp. MO1]|uniref:hypothetical protein n=1 Tax=Methylomonas sp. MO1 TaxID=3073619 RepID=UPI0028A546B9|nr:hypothetical protein [Methylomonas sp. MO1]MDT4288453.1 hypothetical protein [Methylomonas sp. MO1]
MAKRKADSFLYNCIWFVLIFSVPQAHTLNELFNNLARKAHGQEYLKNYEAFLKLALKAQSQCRATLETLSNIKNPPIVFA